MRWHGNKRYGACSIAIDLSSYFLGEYIIKCILKCFLLINRLFQQEQHFFRLIDWKFWIDFTHGQTEALNWNTNSWPYGIPPKTHPYFQLPSLLFNKQVVARRRDTRVLVKNYFFVILHSEAEQCFTGKNLTSFYWQ